MSLAVNFYMPSLSTLNSKEEYDRLLLLLSETTRDVEQEMKIENLNLANIFIKRKTKSTLVIQKINALEKLIRQVSGIYEHASQKFTLPFEADWRLTQAENVLKLAYKHFNYA